MTDPSKEIFDNYLTRHLRMAGPGYKSLDEVNQFHLERLPRWIDQVDKQACILDAGCATGYLLGLLHESGYLNLVGVDLSAQLLREARLYLPETVQLHRSDICEFLARTSDDSFDLILFHHVLEHIPRENTIALLREFRRCLRVGGRLNVKVPNAGYLMNGTMCYCDFTHVVHFNEVSLTQVLEQAGFAPERINFVLHPPVLYWSWTHPLRAVFRLLNRLRWHLSAWVHRSAEILFNAHPRLRCHEIELEIVAIK